MAQDIPTFRLTPAPAERSRPTNDGKIVRRPATTIGGRSRGDQAGAELRFGVDQVANPVETPRDHDSARPAQAGFRVELSRPQDNPPVDRGSVERGSVAPVAWNAQVDEEESDEEEMSKQAPLSKRGPSRFADDEEEDDLPAPKTRLPKFPDLDEELDEAEEEREEEERSKVEPCGRVYNNRDCCDEDAMCRKRVEAIRARGLMSFDKSSLDITPRFRPEADETPEKVALRQSKALAKAGSRSWKDRNGQVVATGRLTDLRNGRAVIDTGSGEQELRVRALSDDDLCFLASWWNLPTECRFGDVNPTPRAFAGSTFAWKASGLGHKPLYWEEVALERYGHTMGPVLQPMLSGVHFVGTIVVLPYKMGIHPPNECQYALGYYRPGNCAPRTIAPLPLSRRGALLQATTVLGAIWILP